MHCPTCGTRSGENDVVCQKCGGLLALSQEELERVEQYRLTQNRDLLSILYIDISGFTRIANRSMILSQKLLALHTTLVTAIVEHGNAGEVVNTAGDGILAVFSNPAIATERALEMQASAYLYQQGALTNLTDDYRTRALMIAELSPQPAPEDDEYRLHIGISLGLVTRGGRTSRDVFGHNVNVACRLSALADRGQIYLSEAVYDNARLILDERKDLEWQTWKDLSIRGLATPMTVVAVSQRPYNSILPPRGMKFRIPRLSRKNAPLVAAIAIPLLLAGGLAGWYYQRTHAVAGESKNGHLQQVNQQANTTTDHSSSTATNVATSATVDAIVPGASLPAGSAMNIALNAVATGNPAANSLNPLIAIGGSSTEIDQFKAESMASGEPIEFRNGTESLPAKVMAISGKDAVLIAVGLTKPVGNLAEMALLVDGDDDNALRTQPANPYTDFLLRASGPNAGANKINFLVLDDGKAGDQLPATEGITAISRTFENGAMWVFRVPYSAMGPTRRNKINFSFQYSPDGIEKPALPYPDAGKLRPMELPGA